MLFTKTSRITKIMKKVANAVVVTIAIDEEMMVLTSESELVFSDANLLTISPIPRAPIPVNWKIATMIDHNPKYFSPITLMAMGVNIRKEILPMKKNTMFIEIAFKYLFKTDTHSLFPLGPGEIQFFSLFSSSRALIISKQVLLYIIYLFSVKNTRLILQ